MRAEKNTLVSYIQQTVEEKKYFFLISYMGLTVAKQEDFRIKLREQNASLRVFKNSLIKEASKNQQYSAVESLDLAKSTALVTGEGEGPAIAKLIQSFAQENKFVKIKVAYFDKQILEEKEAIAIADLPTKDVARAQLLGVLNGASRNLVSILNAKVAKVVYVLNAIKEKKESE